MACHKAAKNAPAAKITVAVGVTLRGASIHVVFGIADKLVPAIFTAKEIRLIVVLRLVLGGSLIDFHSTDRINCHLFSSHNRN